MSSTNGETSYYKKSHIHKPNKGKGSYDRKKGKKVNNEH